MNDPRTYQRTGACFSWEAMDRQDVETAEAFELDELMAEQADAWDSIAAEREAATACLWPDHPDYDAVEAAHAMEDSLEHPLR